MARISKGRTGLERQNGTSRFRHRLGRPSHELTSACRMALLSVVSARIRSRFRNLVLRAHISCVPAYGAPSAPGGLCASVLGGPDAGNRVDQCPTEQIIAALTVILGRFPRHNRAGISCHSRRRLPRRIVCSPLYPARIANICSPAASGSSFALPTCSASPASAFVTSSFPPIASSL